MYSSPLRVIFDARSVTDHYPGIGRYGSSLTHALARRGDIELTLLVDPGAGNTLHPLPPVRQVPAPYPPSSLAQQWAVPGLLRRLRADLYHSPYYLMPYVLPCPAVVTMYDIIPLLVPGTHSAPFRWVYRLTHRLAARAARRVLAISQATADDLAHLGIPRRKIVAVPLGVDPAYHPRPPAETAALRARYGLPDRFALYVGTNKPHKNLGRLIEVWGRLGQPPPLVIAGAQDDRFPSVGELAGRSGAQVLPIGQAPEDDLPVLYSAAELFVFPSLYEGFGLPVLEAMACGTPVVCSNVSSLPEVAGEAALLVDPLDTDALDGAIRRALGDRELRLHLREMGLAQAAHFSWDRTAEATVEAYRQAVPAPCMEQPCGDQ